MASIKKAEIADALKNQVNLIEKLYLRPFQKVAFECSAKCCDDPSASSQDVQNCISKCNYKLRDAHSFVSAEVEDYQDRLQRCVSQCNDEAKDKLGVSPTETQVTFYGEFVTETANQKYIQLGGVRPSITYYHTIVKPDVLSNQVQPNVEPS